MRRRAARGLFVLICGALAAVLGIVSAILYTPHGKALLARLVTQEAHRLVRGSVAIRSVSGTWYGGFALDGVVIRDTAGTLFADVPRLEVRYTLANLLAGRVVVSSATLRGLQLQIIKHRSGRLNYEEIFRLNEGPPGTGPTPLIEIHDLTIDSGRVTIRVPWNPDGRLRSAARIDSALAFERTKPGRRIEVGRDGLEIVRTIDGLNSRFNLVRISSPDRQPVTLDIERLAARISDPGLLVRDLQGQVRAKNDSLLFDLTKAELPGTFGRGAGRIDWPRDTLMYNFNFTADRLALADLQFISPLFPDFRGRARVRARSITGSRHEYDIRDLRVGDDSSSVAGRLVALTDIGRGLGFRDLRLDLTNLDLDDVRAYLDTLPLDGRLTGRLAAAGFFDRMTISLDWLFRDARVAGGAESQLALDGSIRIGGAEGMFFDTAKVASSDIDLRTVRLISPAVILEGRLGLVGTLAGPWKNVVFDGDVEHRDGERRPSRLRGAVRLDTRGEVLGLETDLVLDSLAFDGIRRTFPTLKATGRLGGRVKLLGTLDRLRVDANVGGELGRVTAVGLARLTPPKWGADSLRLTFSALDLERLAGTGPATRLAGELRANGLVVDSAVAPVGQLAVTLGGSRIGAFELDSGTAVLTAAGGRITFDTLVATWSGGRLAGAGSLGWAAPESGKLIVHAEADDLRGFDSLALAATGFVRDSAAPATVLHGKGRADLTLEGSVASFAVSGEAVVDSAGWLGYRVKNAHATVAWPHPDSAFRAAITVDTVYKGRLAFRALDGQASGRPDTLSWRIGASGTKGSRVAAAGEYRDGPGGRLLRADRLTLALLGREWRLAAPLEARFRDSLVVLDTVRLLTSDGSGSVEVAGRLSRGASADLSLTVLGVQLQDVYELLQRDTAGVAGSVALDGRLGGTGRTPEIRGTGAITGAVFGDFRAPLIRSAFDYRDHLLRTNLTFWRAGLPVVEVDASLPADLALTRTARRQLPGPIRIVATGDSVDLAIVEAFTPNLRRVTGSIDVDARIEGSWEEPRLAGHVRFIEGGADVPALGVRYGGVNGMLRLSADSILADSIRVRGGEGSLTVNGGIRLAQLTQPILGLTLSAKDFELINVDDYLRIQAWGDVALSGPLLHPVLTGGGRLTNSVIYFSDLISKEIVNLEDPLVADLVDTVALRQQNLGANFQSRFLDSLAIRDLDFIVGEGVWLRSSEANFQLEGRLRINKSRKQYRVDGNLSTPRGTYTLAVAGFINRTFSVERGTVRYFGDLNAELDVEARHVVKLGQGSVSDLPVIAHITGTLEVPKLELKTPPDRPPMSEQELISMLITGTTDPTAFGAVNAQTALAYGLGAVSAQLQSKLLSSSGQVFDLIEIRPGFASSGLLAATTAPTQFALGRAISSKLFIVANASLCTNSSSQVFSARNLGASLEYRFRRELRFLLSAEPIQVCLSSASEAFSTARRYQFGGELRWDRNY
ncbi:MAG: hypothetical protein HOP28_06950 [Gemmatimonadales bacterium]|nr:hypothetical protein [Gemmatimonadales bacterium]